MIGPGKKRVTVTVDEEDFKVIQEAFGGSTRLLSQCAQGLISELADRLRKLDGDREQQKECVKGFCRDLSRVRECK